MDYDFKNPPKLTADNILTIKILYENFGERLSTWLSSRFQEEITVKEGGSQQILYGNFIARYPYPTILCIFFQPPLSSFFIVWIKPSLAFYLVDKFLGGKGGEFSINRELTSVEKEILKRFLENLTRILTEAWSLVLKIDFKLKEIITNPSSFKAMSEDELIITTNFKVKIKEREEDFSFCLPFISIEPHLERLTTKPKEEKIERNEHVKAIESIPLPVVAILGKTRLTIDEILKLSSGDVLKLSTKVSDGILVNVEEKPRFIGNPGISGRNIGIQIKKVLEEKDARENK